MGPIDMIIIAVILAIIGFAARYVYKSKKSGKKCIGCPEGCRCKTGTSSCNCNGSCHCKTQK